MLKRSIFYSCCLLFAVACNSENSGNQSVSPSTSAVTTFTPEALRAIQNDKLTAIVAIDDKPKKTYLGSKFTDGNWIIDIEVQAGNSYSIVIEWFTLGVLLMEEKGEFFVDGSSDTITTQLDFKTKEVGTSRFDADCDGVSNLVEVQTGSDPTLAETGDNTACEATEARPPNNLEEETEPEITQIFAISPDSDTGSSDRVTRFNQSIQVRSLNSNLLSTSGVTLNTHGGADRQTVFIELQFDPEAGKSVRIGGSGGVIAAAGNNTDTSCSDAESSCLTRFDWQELHWYQLLFEQTTDTSWEASIIDTESQQATVLGTLQTRKARIWIQAKVRQRYLTRFTAASCTTGISPSTIHFTGGIANDDFTLGAPVDQIIDKCVIWGGGSNTGKKTVQGQTIYTLTLGSFE